MRIHSRRGGVLLDAVIAMGMILLMAYALDRLGISFADILQGAAHFFGS
ncbi:MAG: hypothetical protein WAN87_10230 [Thermoplasmata archaeon]